MDILFGVSLCEHSPSCKMSTNAPFGVQERNMNLNVKRAKKGFTLVELLVVVLILAILMAIALPLYLSSVKDSQLKTCQANMKTIANAVQAKYVKDKGAGYFNGGDVDAAACDKDSGDLADLQNPPMCPLAAATEYYSVAGDADSFTVTCPTSHGSYNPASGFAGPPAAP